MNKFSSFLTIVAMLMGVANAVSSATTTLDEFKGSGFLTLNFISGFPNVREVGVVDLISDANKWRQTYSEDGVLEFVLGDYSSSSKVFMGGSRGGLGMIAGVSPDLSRIPFGDLEGKWVDKGVSVSYQDSPTIPLPLPSAVWLFGFTLFVFVVLSTRRQV